MDCKSQKNSAKTPKNIEKHKKMGETGKKQKKQEKQLFFLIDGWLDCIREKMHNDQRLKKATHGLGAGKRGIKTVIYFRLGSTT